MKGTFLLLLVCLGALVVCNAGDLRKNFYKKSCGDAETIVKNVVEQHAATDPRLAPRLLRMHFHDCFVRGCDGSVLLNSTANSTAERDAIPNIFLGGFDVIEEAKLQLENKCPGKVSCADILALAARDAVSFPFNKSMWEVETGRRDGTVSLASEVFTFVPAPTFNFSQLKQNFANKGLTVHDLVVLSGGHTIGVGHCNLFSSRLFNFTGKGDADPTLNATYAATLRTQCKSLSDTTTTVGMDPQSSLTFDSHYFVALKQNEGLFVSDAALLTDKGAAKTIDELTDQTDFFTEFAQSMKRMGKIDVLTGSSGEIRKKCSVVNSS